MIGLSNPKLRNRLARLSRLSYIVVAFAVAFRRTHSGWRWLRLCLQLYAFGTLRPLQRDFRSSQSASHSCPLRLLLPRCSLAWHERGAQLSKAHADLSGRIRAPHQACCGMAR